VATTTDEARTWRLPVVDRRVGAFAVVALVALLVGAAVVAYQLIPRAPGGDSAEAGFLRDMSDHHAQGVEMALILHDRTADESLLTLTTDIAMTQQGQIGTMQGWLDLWDISPTGDDPTMAWMDHPITDGLMPGMATPEQLEQLRTLPVEEAEVLFLQLMIRHHQGGVDMAEALLERGEQAEVTTFARGVVASQQGEINAMNGMLEQRGQSPITDPLPTDDSHTGH
jgi:uncharacterized protein (DUF305 family)